MSAESFFKTCFLGFVIIISIPIVRYSYWIFRTDQSPHTVTASLYAHSESGRSVLKSKKLKNGATFYFFENASGQRVNETMRDYPRSVPMHQKRG